MSKRAGLDRDPARHHRPRVNAKNWRVEGDNSLRASWITDRLLLRGAICLLKVRCGSMAAAPPCAPSTRYNYLALGSGSRTASSPIAGCVRWRTSRSRVLNTITPACWLCDLTVAKLGLYVIKCMPHFSMCTVALVQVGKPMAADLTAKQMAAMLAQLK